jgi:hypothetical protein
MIDSFPLLREAYAPSSSSVVCTGLNEASSASILMRRPLPDDRVRSQIATKQPANLVFSTNSLLTITTCASDTLAIGMTGYSEFTCSAHIPSNANSIMLLLA